MLEDKKVLILTVGLPRSGKSTWARSMGYPIVNPDSIRTAIHGHPFYLDAEPFVWAVAKTMVKSLFLAGHGTVILDATNTTQRSRKEWNDPRWEVKYTVFPTTPDECKRRALMNNQEYLIPIIDKMAQEQEILTELERERVLRI